MILPFIEMIITTRCNLKCDQCSNLIPEYKKAYDVSAENIVKCIDALADAVDIIENFKIHGGEPLLCENFSVALQHTAFVDKIKHIIVPTNGSYVPREQYLRELAQYREKTTLYISNYRTCESNHKTLINLCEYYGVKYVLSKQKMWYSFGEVMDYHYSEQQLINLFDLCEMKRFPSYFNGKIYPCSRIANAVVLKMYPETEEETFDLLHTESKYEKRQKLRKFFEKNSCSYCRYCTMDNERVIESGRQS